MLHNSEILAAAKKTELCDSENSRWAKKTELCDTENSLEIEIKEI